MPPYLGGCAGFVTVGVTREHVQRLARRLADGPSGSAARLRPIVARLAFRRRRNARRGRPRTGWSGRWARGSAPCRSRTAPSPRHSRGSRARRRNTSRTDRSAIVARGLVELGPRGLEVVLRFGGPGPVEQRFAALLGLESGLRKRAVELERRLSGLAGGDPHIAGRGPHARQFSDPLSGVARAASSNAWAAPLLLPAFCASRARQTSASGVTTSGHGAGAAAAARLRRWRGSSGRSRGWLHQGLRRSARSLRSRAAPTGGGRRP